MGSEDYEFNIIKNASGKLSVIRGLDYMGDDFSCCNRRAKAWFVKGGIATICWHCGSDFTGSHTESMNTNLDWDKALTQGTAEYDKLIPTAENGFLTTGKETSIQKENLIIHGMQSMIYQVQSFRHGGLDFGIILII